VGTLRGKLLHYTCTSLAQFIEKQNRYAIIWAEDYHAAGRRTSLLGILLRPFARFMQLYFFRGGILDGTAGLIVCMSNAFYTFLKYANLWQLEHVSLERKLSRSPPQNRSVEKNP
jgi:(heptosyl)LPS beta-1,4-glucosyltransferase